MASPKEKLAESLEVLEALQKRGMVAIRSGDLTRTHRERLVKNGFLREVMKGWYVASRPDEAEGDSTAWYASFWDFCAGYLTERFGEEWSLSPEQSLFLHTGNRSVPKQLLVRAPRARNKATALAHGTSIFENRASVPPIDQTQIVDGLRLFSLPAALVAAGRSFFKQNDTDARAALAMVRDASGILAVLLENGRSTVAGRLAGAFRNIGRNKIADEIVETMRSAGYDVRESGPMKEQTALSVAVPSPYVTRMHLMWQAMRESVIESFPKAPGLPRKKAAYLKEVDEIYVEDAYHSLSIEGYRVSPALIKRVRSGAWDPEGDLDDHDQRDAIAARGYYDAFQSVKESVSRILNGENPGMVADEDHGTWYRRLFAPSVTAGILKPVDLAGYRNDQVYIRRSRHVPPRREAVRDLMPALFDLLKKEPDAAVRAVLGHFMFVFIHPYMDGNGRMARFLMNVMFSSGGYRWTVIPVERRKEYMEALEAASTQSHIIPFVNLLVGLSRSALEGK